MVKRKEDILRPQSSISIPSPSMSLAPLIEGPNLIPSQSLSNPLLATSGGEACEDHVGIPKGTKRTSSVWEYFKEYEKIERVKNSEGKMIEIVHRRAHCIFCPRGAIGDFSVDSNSGTSGLIRHINFKCRYFPRGADKSQKLFVGDKSIKNRLTAVAYKQEDYLRACVEMIVLDELQFSFVEKKGFLNFCMKVCPLFDVPSRRKLTRFFLAMYDDEKKELRKMLKRHRLSLTTDTWTSVQNVNYMVLTAHFVDIDWKMHKRIINFCVIQNHQGSTIGKLIESCLEEWGIEKVMCITVDNAAANKSALEWLVAKMKKSSSYQQILDGKYMHVRCTAHITNLIVGHGLKRLQKSVCAIRNCVKFVRSSPNRLEMFKKVVEKEKLGCKGLVCMDVPTRWNSTYLMLEAALRFKKAFQVMAEDDESAFGNYFKEAEEEINEDGVLQINHNRIVRVGPPEEVDWLKAGVFVDFLRVFYEVTLRNSASLHPTVHTVFGDVIDMENNINDLLMLPRSPTEFEIEKTLHEMASNMKIRWMKYFGSFGDLNNMLIIGLVLDARFKLKSVIDMYTEEMLPNVEVERRTTTIKDLLMALYDQYVLHVDGGIHQQKPESQGSSSDINNGSMIKLGQRAKRLSNWKKKRQESEEVAAAHEVDQYLDAALDPTDDEDHFDILCWWKINGCKFPVLAAIARDVLAIQTSTVASESCFSTGGRVIDPFRSSLTPKCVEGLICLQNWRLGNEIAAVAEAIDEPTIENTEFYYEVEREHESTNANKNDCPPPLPIPNPISIPKAKGKAVALTTMNM